eukprot:1981931-Amphidinium_carterae.1
MPKNASENLLIPSGNHTPFKTPTAARVRSSVQGFLPKVHSLCPLIRHLKTLQVQIAQVVIDKACLIVRFACITGNLRESLLLVDLIDKG